MLGVGGEVERRTFYIGSLRAKTHISTYAVAFFVKAIAPCVESDWLHVMGIKRTLIGYL